MPSHDNGFRIEHSYHRALYNESILNLYKQGFGGIAKGKIDKIIHIYGPDCLKALHNKKIQFIPAGLAEYQVATHHRKFR